jgi:uncharacterized membrane protein YeaQ/YmgE (transglycosylase-associated protein family)
MSLILYLVVVLFIGLITGALARLIVPGPDPMSLFQTALLGIAGSIIAGLISLWIFHGRAGGGILLSVVCSAILVLIVRRSRERRGMYPRRRF